MKVLALSRNSSMTKFNRILATDTDNRVIIFQLKTLQIAILGRCCQWYGQGRVLPVAGGISCQKSSKVSWSIEEIAQSYHPISVIRRKSCNFSPTSLNPRHWKTRAMSAIAEFF